MGASRISSWPWGARPAQGLLEGGVLPIIKHIPGHGRAMSDSHHALPRVNASRYVLDHTDFPPFRASAISISR